MKNISKTVNKAIDILEVFLREEGGLSLTEISKATGINAATTYRLISTLAGRGYIARDQRNGIYSLSLKMLDFNYAIRRSIKFIDFAYLSLNKLVKKLNESAYLTVLDADGSLVVEEIGVSEDLRINSPVGKRLPLYCTACGKILLTSLSEEERQAYYSRNHLHPFTQNTITDVSQLEKELVTVQMEGVAFDKEEYRMGLWGIAAPIYNGRGSVIAAAGIIVPISDLKVDSNQNLAMEIKSYTGEISQVVSRIS